MSFYKAMMTSFQMYKIKSIKGLNMNMTSDSKKLKSSKNKEIKLTDFSLFKNYSMNIAEKQLKSVLKSVLKANKTKNVWPEDPAEKELQKLVKLAKSKGIDSKEVKSGMEKFETILALYIVNLAAPVNKFKEAKKEIKLRLQYVSITRKYTKVLETELAKAVSYPLVITSMQVQLLGLSQQAKVLNRLSGNIESAYKTMLKKTEQLIKEGEESLKFCEAYFAYIRKDGGRKELQQHM